MVTHAGSFEVAHPRRVLGALAERGELVADAADQTLGAADDALGARGLLLDRLADALLDLGAVALQRSLDVALALAGPTLDLVAGLARLGDRFAAGGRAATLSPF